MTPLILRQMESNHIDCHQVSEEITMTDGICLEPIKQTDAAHFQSWTTGFEYQVGHYRMIGIDCDQCCVDFQSLYGHCSLTC